MRDILQVRWTEARFYFFPRLPLLWATNIDKKGSDGREKGTESSTPSVRRACIPRESQLTWVSQWWRALNKCIRLIIKDSLNEDRHNPLKVRCVSSSLVLTRMFLRVVPVCFYLAGGGAFIPSLETIPHYARF